MSLFGVTAASRKNARAQSSASTEKSSGPSFEETLAKVGESSTDVKNNFLKVSKMNIFERIRERVLKKHNLTEDSFQALSADQRKEIEDEIKKEIEKEMKSEAQGKKADPTTVG